MAHVDDVTASQERPPAGQIARNRSRAWLFMLPLGALIALLAFAVAKPSQDAANPTVKQAAPDFTMPLFSGGTLHLKSLRGKTVVLNFWASWCQPCVQEAPILERQWRAWKDKGVVFVGIDTGEDPHSDAVRQFLHQYNVTYPNGWDASAIDILYPTTGQPETFFITPRGMIVRHVALPFTDDQTLSRYIQEARA
jgi:cytochrome c biogenesis protein CcmG, thiol:disulfide interchange protein DsbE